MEIKRTIDQVKSFPELGERIKIYRQQDPRSLVALCELAGVSRSYWYQIEDERLLAPVSEEVIRKIEAALNVDLNIEFPDPT